MTPILFLLVGVLVVLVALAVAFFVLRGASSKGKILFIGLRSSTNGVHLRRGRPVNGVYTWKEGKDIQMDIHLDGAFVSEVTSKERENRAVLVDLDTGHVIRYMGACLNDDEPVVVKNSTTGKTVTIEGVWKRLPGSRLYKIRKDLRVEQMNQYETSIWTTLVKVVPIALIIIGLVLVAILGVLMKGLA